MTNSNTNPFLSNSLASLLFKFSAPAVAGMMSNAAYNIIARLLVGQETGALGIAGITLVFPIAVIFTAFSAFLGVGGNALFSISLGKKDYKKAELILGNTVAMLIIVCTAITVFFYIFLDPALKILGATPEVMPYARDYSVIGLIGLWFFGIGAGLNNFIRSSGHPKIAFMTQIIGNIVNVIVGPVFIYYWHWGVKGAALATVCGQFVGFIWMAIFFFGKKCQYKIKLRNMILKLKIILECCAIGVSQLIFQLSTSILNLVLNHSLIIYGGNVALASIGIIMSINSIIVFAVLGISQGSQPLIGYNYGAEKYANAIQTTKMAIRWGIYVLFLGFVITEIFAKPIVMMFNAADTELINLAARGLRFVNLMLPIISIQILASTYFQAINKPIQATILSLSRQVLLVIPFVLILPLFIGLDGVFLAMTAADFFSCIIAAYLLHKFFHKHNQTLFINARLHKKVAFFQKLK